MNINYISTIKQEDCHNNLKSNNEGISDEYLYDSNLNVSTMIKKVWSKIYYYYFNYFCLV